MGISIKFQLTVVGFIFCLSAAEARTLKSSPTSINISMSTPAPAMSYYVRPGAAGNGNGSDWTNAFSSLPANLIRGATYFLADGNYGSRTFNTPNSGTLKITLKKCTEAEHGTNTGYNSTYCDGQVVFSDMNFDRGDYYVIDGSKRNENNWADSAAYGIRNSGSLYSSRLNSSAAACSDNLTFLYVDVGANVGTSVSAANGGVYLGGFGGGSLACDNWTISRSHIHNTPIPVQCAGCNSLLIEYTHFGTSWGKESIRGQVHASNNIIRHNHFKDSCQKDPADNTSGCTGEIAMWDGSDAGAFSGNQIYGNIFQKTTTEHNSGGVIIVGGNGVSWVGVSASNTLIYNNTLVGFKQGTAMILVNGGTNNSVINNIWYDIGAGVSTVCSANICLTNSVLTSNPFVSYPDNLNLARATPSGTSLPAPYNIDAKGISRGADGIWDLGAFEFR